MDNFEILNENNVFNYQMKSYDNPQCHSMEEFLDDMKRIKYVKRLFHKYHTKDILKERLIINHTNRTSKRPNKIIVNDELKSFIWDNFEKRFEKGNYLI